MVFHTDPKEEERKKRKWGYKLRRKVGGIRYITCDGEDYVTHLYKRPVCWLTGHDVVTPENKEVDTFCKRCGQNEVKSRKGGKK